MRNEKGEITIKSIWKWLRSDKGKRYSFFVFYFFFFIILFLLLSFDWKNVDDVGNKENNKENNLSLPFSTSLFEEVEYDFIYRVNIDSKKQDFLGEKDNQNIILKDDRGIYNYLYQNGKLMYQGNNNPIRYDEFLDFYEIKRIIKNSMLVSETKLSQTNEYVYTYQIKNKDLLEMFNKSNLQDDNLENQIEVRTDTNKKMKEISLDISNYVNLVNEIDEDKTSKYEIVITYGDYYE